MINERCLVLLLAVWVIFSIMVGKVRAGEFEFTGSLSLAETYSDNIDLAGRDGDVKEDFITSITPGFSLSYLSQRSEFTASYAPDFLFYSKNPDENEVHHNADLDFNSRLTRRLSLSMTDRLTYTFAQQIAGPELGARTDASDQLNNDFNTTISYRAFDPTNIRLGYTHSLVKYERSELADSHEEIYNFGIDQDLTSRDTLSFDYRYRRLFTEEENDTDLQSISIGETHRFPGDLVLSISVGIARVDELDLDFDEEPEWTAGVDITKNFRTGTLGLAYARDVYSSQYVAGTSVIQIINITGTRDFTRHFHGNFTCFFSTEESITGEEVDDEDVGLILGSSYDFTRKLAGTVAGSYTHHNSRTAEEDNDTYRGSMGATYQLRPWCRSFLSYAYYLQNALEPAEWEIENNIVTVGIELTWL